VANVMGADAFWPLLAALGAIAGGVCGAAYAMARRKFVALGTRRTAGEPLGLKGRAIAGVYREMVNLNGRTFFVSATASNGVVDTDTRLRFSQIASRVIARYAGENVLRGCLVGRPTGDRLDFRYAQRETDAAIHGGRSECEVQRLEDGRTRIIEHFTWSTRVGSGTNVFDELDP